MGSNPVRHQTLSSGTLLAIGLVVGGAILGLLALKYRQYEPPPTRPAATQMTER